MVYKNIVLIGFMASGKTIISNSLGKLLGREVVSSDDCIQKKEGKSIVEIFEEKGESYFRKIEKEIIRDISQRKNIIVDCGGGVVIEKKNMDHLSKNGIIFFLSATPNLVYQRIKGKKNRPILNVEDPLEEIKKLMKIRQPIYEQSDYSIKVDNMTVKQISEIIIKKETATFNLN